MAKAIISDTSCLIALDSIGEIEILNKLFQEIFITPEIQEEFQKKLPPWVSVRRPSDKDKQSEIEKILDRGESSVITLALETSNCLLIIDERKGRRLAADLQISIAGTLRILLYAKEKGVIDSVRRLIDKLEKNGFRLTKDIKLEILKEANE